MAETKCPECGLVLSDEKVCPNCGCPIVEEQRVQLRPCCDCGHMVASDAELCPQCGGQQRATGNCGQLRIYMEGNGKKNIQTAPLYVNGQLIEAVMLSEGCDITIPISNSNIKVGYLAPLTYVEHTYRLSNQQDYTLVITNGVDLGFTLYGSENEELSCDKFNALWLIFSILFGVFAVLISFKEANSISVRSKCLRTYGLLVTCVLLLFALPLAI